jgi:hypothetical protein
MSKAAAQSFISAVKVARADFDKESATVYKEFIAGKKTPTTKDLAEFADVIKKAEELAKIYHRDVAGAMLGFGGSADSALRNAKIMLQTLAKAIKK